MKTLTLNETVDFIRFFGTSFTKNFSETVLSRWTVINTKEYDNEELEEVLKFYSGEKNLDTVTQDDIKYLIEVARFFKNTSNKAEKEFSYYYYLKYNNKNRGIEEVKLGEPISHIINRGQFPLYFYLKLKEKKDINIIVNFRLKADIDS